jgi:cell division septation protein DedD
VLATLASAVTRDSFDTFTLPDPEAPRPSLGERFRPLLVLGSTFVIAAACAAWLTGPSPARKRTGEHDALTNLVEKSTSEAQGFAADARTSLDATPVAASKVKPVDAAPTEPSRDVLPKAKSSQPSESAQPHTASPQPVAAPADVTEAVPAASEGAAEPAPLVEASDLEQGFHIQVASLKVKETAERLAESLRRQGFRARSDPYGYSRSDWWHVVRIGPFSSRIAAEGRRLQLGPVQRATAVVLPRARGKHHVQVASLRSQEKAAELLDQLRQRGYSARITTVGRSGGERWHCVRIGPFDSRDEAAEYRALLEAREGTQSEIVPFSRDE